METITLTFGDCAENHRGMQEIGEKAKVGLSHADLISAMDWFTGKGIECEIVNLAKLPGIPGIPDAYLLIAKNGCSALVDVKELTAEQNTLERDTKAFMYGRVVNKKARHNLCFSDFEQAPDYQNKKGTVVNFNRLPCLSEFDRYCPKLEITNFPIYSARRITITMSKNLYWVPRRY